MAGATVFTLINTKGGVGKTSLSANLAGYFTDVAGQRVLMVDADVQPTLSSYFPLARKPRAGLVELLLRGSTHGVITPSVLPNLDVVVSNDNYGELQGGYWSFRSVVPRDRVIPSVRSGLTYLFQSLSVIVSTCSRASRRKCAQVSC